VADLDELLEQLHALSSQDKGSKFERLTKWWLETSPLFQKLNDPISEVWLWPDWPGNWGADKGIDLVAQTESGELLAVQAKAYAPEHSISKRDVDKFLSESARTTFSRRLLVGTTDKVNQQAVDVMDNQEKPVERYLLSDLEAEQISWPVALDDLSQVEARPRHQAREHQREALKSIVAGLSDVDRGQAIMSCGTGKTLVGLWAAERLRAQRVLVLVPSLALMAQTIREWTANGLDFRYLPVCSETEVAGSSGSDRLEEQVQDAGIPSATTDPAVIRAFLASESDCPLVVFSTYQSADKVAEAQKIDGDSPLAFDLGLFDEAHNCAGASDSTFALGLDDTRLACRKRLFMTATPRFITGRKKDADENFVTTSMDDEDLFGPEIYRLDFAEAIDRDLLSNYQVIIAGVSDVEVQELADNGTFLRLEGGELDDKRLDARTLAAHITVAKAIRDHDLEKVITFHSRVKAAKDFSTLFPKITEWLDDSETPSGSTWAEHVSGAMTGRKREALLNAFRHLDSSHVGILSNARCLAEGVDVPSIDGIAFIDPKASQVDIIQAVGRAIRKSPDKETGIIILPVYIGEGQDPEEVLESGSFQSVWQVIRALRAHDSTLGAELERLRAEIGSRGVPGRMPGRLSIDVAGRSVKADFSKYFETRLIEKVTDSWFLWFGKLGKYISENGSFPSKKSPDPAAVQLADWCSTQRQRYKKGLLAAERVADLESLAEWAWSPYDASWNKRYFELVAYLSKHGKYPSRRDEDRTTTSLGVWCIGQRSKFKAGALSQERVSRLESLKGWSWDPVTDSWNKQFDALRIYLNANSCTPSQVDPDPDVAKLGMWCNTQRVARRKGLLSKERVKRLEGLQGWQWSARPHNK
jgi:predicted helicase